MYYGASLFTSINPFLLLGSAHAVVIRAVLLFIVHFPVIKYIRSFCHSYLKYGGLVGPDDVASLKYRYRFWKPKYLELLYAK